MEGGSCDHWQRNHHRPCILVSGDAARVRKLLYERMGLEGSSGSCTTLGSFVDSRGLYTGAPCCFWSCGVLRPVCWMKNHLKEMGKR